MKTVDMNRSIIISLQYYYSMPHKTFAPAIPIKTLP